MKCNYYISFNSWSTETEIFPSNSPKIKGEQYPGEIFIRDTVDLFIIGAVKNATVYTTLDSYFFDDSKFATEIGYKIVSGSNTFLFAASISDGKIDTEKRVYQIAPRPDDNYRLILEEYEKKWQDRGAFNFISSGDTLYYPVLNTALFVNVDFTTFSDVAGTVNYTNTTGGATYAKNDLDIVTGTNQVVIVIVKNLNVVAGANCRIRLVDAADASLSAQQEITADGKYLITQTSAGANVFLQLEQIDVAGSSGSFDYEIFLPTAKNTGALVEDIIGDILNGNTYMNLGVTLKSTILWNDALGSDPPPSIDTYITSNPTKDYVIEGTAIWNGLWLTRTDAFTTAKETKLETSLRDIMDVLKKIRVWWFIDEDGDVRIEHEKYFRDYTPQLDITSGDPAAYKPEVDVLVYNYVKEESYSQLNYSESNEGNEDFIAYPVLFNATVTTKRIKDVRFDNLTTDFDYVKTNPGTAQSSGMMLLRTYKSATGLSYMIDIDESTLTADTYYTNAKLGWAWLVKNYYDYFAEAISGTINDGDNITYEAVKEFLYQDDIRFFSTTALDWKKPITTQFGTGWIRSYEYDPETGFYSVNLGYDPYL